jgi:hypothetical protein
MDERQVCARDAGQHDPAQIGKTRAREEVSPRAGDSEERQRAEPGHEHQRVGAEKARAPQRNR